MLLLDLKIQYDHPLKKFGTVLVPRPSGKEAWLAFQPTFSDAQENEEVTVDFSDIAVFTPSWADEFLTPLHSRFPGKVRLINTDNASIEATLATPAKQQPE